MMRAEGPARPRSRRKRKCDRVLEPRAIRDAEHGAAGPAARRGGPVRPAAPTWAGTGHGSGTTSRRSSSSVSRSSVIPTSGRPIGGRRRRLCPDQIEHGLETRRIGRRIAVWNRVGSTNDLAARAGSTPANDGLVVLAEEQTAGRGQRGRTWTAPARSSILMSVLLFPPPDLPLPGPEAAAGSAWLTALAAVATAELVSDTHRVRRPDQVAQRRPRRAAARSPASWSNAPSPRRRSRARRARSRHRPRGVVIGIGLNVDLDLAAVPPSSAPGSRPWPPCRRRGPRSIGAGAQPDRAA